MLSTEATRARARVGGSYLPQPSSFTAQTSLGGGGGGQSVSQGGLSEPLWAPSHHFAADEPERTAAAAPPRGILGNVVSAPPGIAVVTRFSFFFFRLKGSTP